MRRRFRLSLAVAAGALWVPSVGSAQDGATVTGRVTSEAGTPLASASVFIDGLNIGALTRDDGVYSFVVPAARVQGQAATLSARLLGYKATTVPITLLAGTITQDFRLAPNPLRLGEVVVDLRTIQEISEEDGDRVYAGVAKVLEAMIIGLTADVFGDIPYREAAQTGVIEQPVFDPQAQVYADLQALLTEAIADIQSGAGDGPAAVFDLVHRADFDKWVEAAYTLKARLYLHTVEQPNDGVNLTAYQNAIAAANNGISSPANDWRAFHGSATSERNIWYQFSQTTFGQDIVAGKALADLMVARSDPRLDDYFGLNANGGYGGYDAPTDGPADQDEISPFTGSLRNVPNFRQPLISWEENQLILAEAKLMTQSIAAAQPHLDAVRAQYGLLPVPASLENIILEKYVALFQNIEVWSDYKRTCFPRLTPVPDADFGHGFGDEVPGRLFYDSTEMSANLNTPSIGSQLSNGGVAGGRAGVGGFRNPNDPNACS